MKGKKYVSFCILVFFLFFSINLIVAQDDEISKEADRKGNYISEVGVEYDFEIVDYFSNQTLVEELISQRLDHVGSLEIIDNETYIRVLIYFKDSLEVSDFILDFSDGKLKDVSNLNAFSSRISVKVTEAGFNKLIQDGRVDKIYYDFPVRAFDSIGGPLLPFKKKGIGTQALIVVIILIIIMLLIIFFMIIKKKKILNKK